MPVAPPVPHPVLILAPTGRDGALAARVLDAAGMVPKIANSNDALFQAMDDDTGAVLIAEEALSPALGALLAGWLRAQPAWSDLPIVLLGSRLDPRASTARLEQLLPVLGNVTVIERPVGSATLIASLKAALRARERQYEARTTLLQLAKREEELERADQRKNEFLAMLSHELRNPLAAITVAVELWKPGSTDVEKGTRHREIAKRQLGNLARLVDDLLEVSRITRGVVELQRKRVDFAEVVEQAVAGARPSVEQRGHALSLDIADGPYPLHADPTRLEQIVANLLSNAAKYTPAPGLVHVSVKPVSLGMRGPGVVLEVKDSGRGIPENMLSKIFDLFVQVDESIDRAAGGLGLGLTLVKQLSRLHGGDVTVSSDGANRGSTFRVELPLDAAENTALEKKAKTAGETKGHRFLVVEDSDDIRETMKEMLELMGHEVEVASTGQEGADAVLQHRPDVSFIDVGLPGMDGYEVARHVRAQPRGEELFLVALTGYGGSAAKAKARDAGFDLHLTKPFKFSELQNILDHQASRAESVGSAAQSPG